MSCLMNTLGITFMQIPSNNEGNALISFLPIIVMFVVLYFLTIRPQMKRQKEHRQLLESISIGDEVIISSGLIGRINKIYKNNYIKLEISEINSQSIDVLVQKSCITTVLPKESIKSLN